MLPRFSGDRQGAVDTAQHNKGQTFFLPLKMFSKIRLAIWRPLPTPGPAQDDTAFGAPILPSAAGSIRRSSGTQDDTASDIPIVPSAAGSRRISPSRLVRSFCFIWPGSTAALRQGSPSPKKKPARVLSGRNVSCRWHANLTDWNCRALMRPAVHKQLVNSRSAGHVKPCEDSRFPTLEDLP